MMDVAKAAGFNPIFAGAFREPGLPEWDEWSGHQVVRLGKPFPLLNGRRLLTYVSSVAAYNLALARLLAETQPTIVHCSDVETSFGALAARRLRGQRRIYNIHDNIAQRYQLPAPARWLLNQIEGGIVRSFDIALTPEGFRREALPAWARNKVAVVRNTPRDPGFSPPPPSNEIIRIFFGGWLDWGRGLGAILDLVAENPDFELRVAGEGSPDVIAKLRASPRVTYLGFLDHQAILAETAQAHLIPALYDPARLINRFAASNKLAEALAVGRPILINSEMMIAREFGDSSCVIKAPYSEVVGCADSLRAFVRSSDVYLRACNEARDLYQRLYSWDVAETAMQEAIGVVTCRKSGYALNGAAA
jgi:glycosyltransferase involved in cell wall biosynthesis